MIEIARGTMKSMIGNQSCKSDLIPVDIVVNTMITAGWMNGFKKYILLLIYFKFTVTAKQIF